MATYIKINEILCTIPNMPYDEVPEGATAEDNVVVKTGNDIPDLKGEVLPHWDLAKKYEIPCVLLCDTNHVLTSDYSEVIIVGAGADAVDFKLICLCHAGDIVVTQDYGVAAMALGKKARALHQNGKEYTNENIDQMLFERHLCKKARRNII